MVFEIFVLHLKFWQTPQSIVRTYPLLPEEPRILLMFTGWRGFAGLAAWEKVRHHLTKNHHIFADFCTTGNDCNAIKPPTFPPIPFPCDNKAEYLPGQTSQPIPTFKILGPE